MRFNQRLLPVIGILVVLILTALLSAGTQIASAQGNAVRLDYTTNRTATGEITRTQISRLYVFKGTKGDVVTIAVLRSSGNLKPIFGLLDLRLAQNERVIATSKVSPNGELAGLVKFKLPSSGDFYILVTREGLDKGTTTGKFVITLLKDTGSTGQVVTATRRPGTRATATRRPGTRATATPTRRARATATPEEEEPTPEETEEATDESSTESVQTFEVGASPIGALWNGANLFVANSGDGTISVLSGDGDSVRTIRTGGTPGWMAWDGRRLWVPDLGTEDDPSDSVNLFDTRGRKVATHTVGSQPYSLSYDADSKLMWIALYGDNKVVSVDAEGEIVTTVDTETNPNTVLWTGDRLWVTLAGPWDDPNNQVIAVDPEGSVIGTYKVGRSPADLAWNPDDELLYVANTVDNNVMALNTDGKVVGTYTVGKEPVALLWDGEHLWVSLAGDNAVVALSNDGKVLAKVPVAPGPNGLAFDGTNVWVVNQGTSDEAGSTVTRIDVAAALGQ